MATVSKKRSPSKAVPAEKPGTPKSFPVKDQQATHNPEPALLALFTDELKDIYWAENKLVKTLPNMQKAATAQALKSAIGKHLEQTKEHVARLEKVFSILGKKAQAKKCDAMEGLAMEGESIIEDTDEGTATRDAGIIMASQKVEHYEIATYSALQQIATVLGLTNIASLLATTLEEEKQTATSLTSIAEKNVYDKALGE
ncbi:Ferritin-like metal-binding protein YciE [Chitinophaga costaii]|uniref:Ferritin-like metal-binding protein YciE n=1 Tax=Chitinophaga costaii TaxID=1335309 RepID=A0A1C4EH08_9BACT|nr:ferritin-like domain-containing protein [Chitinophaga costaii]PUZ23830.1 ferritin-like domain-containing protein [Chitinophaga costaii]SCC42855.1 Ferritin-like metal-binding protein YciE [Chitinophaga costaii]